MVSQPIRLILVDFFFKVCLSFFFRGCLPFFEVVFLVGLKKKFRLSSIFFRLYSIFFVGCLPFFVVGPLPFFYEFLFLVGSK